MSKTYEDGLRKAMEIARGAAREADRAFLKCRKDGAALAGMCSLGEKRSADLIADRIKSHLTMQEKNDAGQ